MNTYFLRTKIAIVVVSFLLLVYRIALTYVQKAGWCKSSSSCLLPHDMVWSPTFAILAFFVFCIACFLFSISDRIFRAWVVFSVIWAFVTLSWMTGDPTHLDAFSWVPTVETEVIAIWMGLLFAYVSMVIFRVMTWRENRGIKAV